MSGDRRVIEAISSPSREFPSRTRSAKTTNVEVMTGTYRRRTIFVSVKYSRARTSAFTPGAGLAVPIMVGGGDTAQANCASNAHGQRGRKNTEVANISEMRSRAAGPNRWRVLAEASCNSGGLDSLAIDRETGGRQCR
jgi:hypothetical protein